MDQKNLLLIGCGKMAKAMLDGWLCSDKFLKHLSISVVSPNSAKQLPAHSNLLTFSGIEELPTNKTYHYIAIAIKPQKIKEVLPSYKSLVSPQTLLITFVAGVSFSQYHQILSPNTPIIRAMPNTPCSIRQGTTLLVAESHVSHEQKSFATLLLEATGCVEELATEDLLDIGMLISGCAPAYIELLAESMQKEAVALGIPEDTAQKIVKQTLLGTASLINQSNLTVQELREQVCSPGGVTLEVLKPLLDTQNGLQHLLKKGFQKGIQRSQELALLS